MLGAEWPGGSTLTLSRDLDAASVSPCRYLGRRTARAQAPGSYFLDMPHPEQGPGPGVAFPRHAAHRTGHCPSLAALPMVAVLWGPGTGRNHEARF